MPPAVSINIPCYRQLDYARRSVGSVLAQSFQDFEITLFDDGGSEEYRSWVASLGDARVRYHANAARLGSMRNMFAAITAGSGKYTLAFHEDDLLGRHYLEAAVDILERHPECAFVSCEMREFASEPAAADLARPWDGRAYQLYPSRADFVRAIFSGVEPTFGSNVYRRTAVAGVVPAHDDFATLVDRPFLLSLLERGAAAIVRAPLAWYRRHAEDDGRHQAMTAAHVLRLFETYRAVLPATLDEHDRALYERYTGYWLFELYRLTPPGNRPALARFLFEAWQRGLWQPRVRGPFGLKRIGRALVSGR